MYQALYRKYRPKDFESVVGQDALVRTLKNSIVNGTFSHAYMFFGPRGTGKTTMSKIFARAVNCLSPVDGSACGNCKNCLHSFEKECVDIIEIDAASNNGVDEIRELKNKISLVPAELKYKVYIIDEVHMLSIGAFNALLKTLEEPPEHAIFILATTDPQKVPETIISRCQCFSFKRISDDKIVERLKKICSIENILIDDDVLGEIAILSEGGMRDALGMLDKLHSFSNDKIVMNDFIELNDMITRNDLQTLLDAIMNADIQTILNRLENYKSSGKNLIQIISQLMNYLKNTVISYYLENAAVDYDVDKLILLTNIINEKMFDIKKSGNPSIYIEMLLLKFVNDCISKEKNISREIFSNADVRENSIKETSVTTCSNIIDNNNNSNDNNDDNNSNSNNDNNSMTKISVENVVDSDIEALHLKNLQEIMKVRVNNTLALADKQILKTIINNMSIFNDYTFDDEIGYIACSLLDAKVRAASVDSVIISYDYDSIVKQNLLNLDKITDVFNKLTNFNKKIAIITDDEWEKVKKDYILSLKNGEQYKIIEEPAINVFEGPKEDDIIVNSAVELFGDIVEMD
mgnify:FL=1